MKNVFYQTETARGSASPQAAAPRRLRTKRLIALAAALLCGMNWAWAQNVNYNSTYQCGSNTLYLLIDQYAKTAEVVCPEVTWSGTPGYTYHPKPTGVLEIPMSVNFGNIPCTITAIGEKAFMSCSDLTEVRIPSSVTRIKDYAFDGCTSLAKVNIPSTVTVINRYVFRNCTSLTSVTIPSSVTAIYPAAFDGCTSLASFPIPNSVTSIGAYAFRNCHPSSPSITISSSVTQIESEAFYGCGFLAVTLNSNDVVSLDYNEGAFCSIFGDQVERYIIGSNVTKIGNYAFKDCTGLTLVTIPGSVTQIGTHAFEGCTGLSSVTIPGSVTQIGNNAFQDCTGLTSIFLNNGLEELGYAAFRNCIGLTSVSLPNSLTEIGSYAFDGCTGLTSVSISGSVTEIGYNAFQNCTGLSSVTIPSSVQTIGNKVFEGCSNLTSVTINSNAVASTDYSYTYISPTNTSYDNFRSRFGNQVTSYTLGSQVTAIGKNAFYGCTGMTEVTFSNSLTSIGMTAFKNCIGLTSVSFPNSLNSIYINAFENCTGLTSVSFPNSLTSISEEAFKNTGLTRVDIPSSVQTIGQNAFINCPNLTLVYIASNAVASKEYSYGANTAGGNNNFCTRFGNQVKTYIFGSEVTAIGRNALHNCTGVTKVIFYGNLTTIGQSAFRCCTSLTSIQLPNTVTAINDSAFEGCLGLTSLNLPNSLTSISSWAFNGCTGLTSLNFPNSLTSIGDYAFSGCTGLTSLNFPNSLTSIGMYAFSSCTGLTTLKFPNSLTSIGMYAFSSCTNIQTMIVRAVVPPTAYANTFENVPKNIPVYVPSGTIQAYKSATGWKDFYNISEDSYIVFADSQVKDICVANWDTNDDGELSYIEAEDITNIGTLFKGKTIDSFDELQYFTGLTIINNDAFNGCSSLASITLPNTITSIGNYAFADCTGLTSIQLPNTITSIGRYAFKSCINLTSINIPNTLTTIQSSVFWECTGLTSITIPNSVTTIGLDAFGKCTGLTSVQIPNSVTTLHGFNGCTGLTSVILPNSILSIGDNTFKSCINLTSITLPNTITSIGRYAFADCTGLTSIEIPNSVTSIGWRVFENCTGLTSVILSNSLTSIAQYAFAGCTNLQSISVLAATPPEVDYYAFNNVPHNIPVYVPCGSSEAYQNAPLWSAFPNITEVCNIEFEDPLVEAICVANWDTNDDDELSYAEAAAVVGLNSKFEANDQITSFDELQYFTGLTDIGAAEFINCTSLTSIILPPNITMITEYAFSGCSFTSITLPEKLTYIDEGAFQGCTSLTSITLPEGLIKICCYAFDGTGLESISIPASVTEIELEAFFCSNLESIEVHPDNTIYTSNNGCNLIVEKASNTVILGCANSDIYEGVQQIERYAFYNVTGTLTLPSTLKGIGAWAFYDCTNLASIRVNATTPPTLDTDAFKQVPTTIPVYVPCSCREAYQSAEGWSNFTNIQEDCNITLTIAGYGNNPTTTEGWHLIASPLEGVSPENVGNMLSNNYDLYQFHGSFEGAEWRNYKNNENNGFTMLYAGDGYLYANSEDVTLEFKGSVLNLQEYPVYLIKDDDTRFGNWNLVGNSFTTEATVSKTDYYRIEPGTRTLMPSSGNVNPMEGIFVEANEDSEMVTFTKLTRGERAIESPMVNIDLRNAEGRLLDRARLRTGEGAQLSKLDMLSDPNRLYFRIDGKDYAVARVNGQGEMPLNFDAAQNGTYSLNVNVEGMEMAYLHLIDNMTGEDIDLLATSTGSVSKYTFTGKPSDYASRFRLVFETGSSAEGDSFAFVDAAGNIVITNAEAGATLQVIDVTGRVVVCRDASNASAISTSGMTAGVYVLRLIDGDDVKTQKIVVD